MRVGNVVRGVAPAALLIGVLTGCSSAQDGGKDKADDAKTSAQPSKSTQAADADADMIAEKGGTVGGSGSPCELPVTFDLTKSWKAEAVGTEAAGTEAGEAADLLLRQGPVTLACEIDAKPAGNIGYLRAWTGGRTDDSPRAVLEAFVADEGGISEETYSEFTAGELSGTEVEYLYTNEFLEETKKERALAVTTPDGPVVLHLGGLDTEEHEAMLPAYELAKKSLRLT